MGEAECSSRPCGPFHSKPSLDSTLRTEDAVVAACRVGEARRQGGKGDPQFSGLPGGWCLVSILGIGVQKEQEKG